MKVLLEFRAGKMKLEERKLVPDMRRGRARITEDIDGLRHVQWGPESSSDFVAEQDVIVMPDQADYRKVGPANERVYELKFRDKSCTLFFWMQENDASKDANISQSFNAIIQNQVTEPSPQQGTNVESATGVPDAAALAQLLSQIAGSPSSGGSGGGGPSQPNQQSLSLQQQAVLAAALLSSACGMPMRGIPKAPTGPSLAQVLEPDTFVRYVQQPGMLERLAEYLPESQRTQDALESQCLSPQFHQQLKVFSNALQTGQFDPAALGLQVEGLSSIDFLIAIQKLVDQEKEKQRSE